MKPEQSETELPESESAPNSDNQPSPKEVKGGGEPSSAGSSANLDSIADDLSGNMPDVQEHAIEQEILNQNEKLAQYSHLKDVSGNPFDPAIHKVNKAGEPTVSPKGNLIKKPGRKAASVGTSKTSSVVGGAQSVTSKQEVDKMQARASGMMAANLMLQIGIVAGGEEWHPRRDENTGLNEKAMLESAFGDYFEATGKTDIPPGMALTVAIGAYVLPRFTMPKTQSRLSKVKTGLKQWWINRKLKKHGLVATPTKKDERDKTNAKMEA